MLHIHMPGKTFIYAPFFCENFNKDLIRITQTQFIQNYFLRLSPICVSQQWVWAQCWDVLYCCCVVVPSGPGHPASIIYQYKKMLAMVSGASSCRAEPRPSLVTEP